MLICNRNCEGLEKTLLHIEQTHLPSIMSLECFVECVSESAGRNVNVGHVVDVDVRSDVDVGVDDDVDVGVDVGVGVGVGDVGDVGDVTNDIGRLIMSIIGTSNGFAGPSERSIGCSSDLFSSTLDNCPTDWLDIDQRLSCMTDVEYLLAENASYESLLLSSLIASTYSG